MVFPLYDENPFKKPSLPFITWTLILINVAVFLLEIGSSQAGLRALLANFGVTPAAVTREIAGGTLPPELTLVTSLFLHGGWEHLLGNMVYLWVFGDDIEEALGRVRFLVFYLFCGVLASLAFVAFNAQSTTPLIGASGAISGVLAAYLMIRPCAKVSVLVLRVVLRVRAFWVIGFWVVLQLYLFANAGADDNTAYLAHIGGAVAGAILLMLMKPDGLRLFECTGEPDTFGSVFGR